MRFVTGYTCLAALASVARPGRAAAHANPDVVQPGDVPSLRGPGHALRVLADVDQDGFLFARDPRDRELFNRRGEFFPRRKHELQIVFNRGKVCLRKRFHFQNPDLKTSVLHQMGMYFLNEVAALKRLQGSGYAPNLLGVDFRRKVLDMEYIDGTNVRQFVAREHRVLDVHAAADPALDALSATEACDRVFALAAGMLPDEQKKQILETYRRIHSLGVIPRDIHPANIVIGRRTGQPYVVDFELAYLGRAATADRAEDYERALALKLRA